jgi:Flp pilus assembly pilin Flp
MTHRSPGKLRHSGRWRRFLRDQSAVTAIEYGLMTALIGLTIIGTVSAAGQAIRDTLYGQIVNALASMTK